MGRERQRASRPGCDTIDTVMKSTIALFATLAVLLGIGMPPYAQTWEEQHVRSLILAGNTTNYGNTLTLAAPSLSTSPTITLPGASLTFPTTNATGVLLNNGSGTLSWLDITGILTNPMTSPGDMIYGGLLGIPTRLAATSTAHQILLSGANAAPSWSTATYPATSGSAGNYLRSDGTNFVSTTIQAADVPTLNQNTTGTASNVTGVVALANGGTGVTNASGVAQAAFFAGPASGGAGAASWRAIQATDVPTLNQNTTGSAAKLTTARTIAGTSFDGSANITLANKFIVQGTADAGLSGAQFLGSLSTGLVKNTTSTGVLSIATAGTDYSAGTSALGTGILKSTTGTGALTIAVAADFPTLNQNTTGTASNVTGLVALANGGTGVTNASGVAQNAVFAGPASGGAGAASWRTLTAADLAAGSGNYIQNSSSPQSSANFNISGNGTIGGTLTAPTHTGGDGTTGTALTVRGGNGSSGAGAALTLTGGSSTGTSAGAGVTIAGTNASTSGTGGAISVTAGNGAGTTQSGGAISLTAGNGGATTSAGGAVTITAGNGGSTSGNGGSITLQPGTATSGTAGGVGINTSSPNTTLDLSGDFANRASTNSTATTTFDSLPTTGASVIDLTGPTANFTIASIGQGYDGKKLTI